MWTTSSYEDLLSEWYNIRQQASSLPLEEALHLINDWWAKAPMVNHLYHIADYEDWPLPWDLLGEQSYCELAKCLGIVYTILLTEHADTLTLQIAQTNDYNVVRINNGQYVLNNEVGEITADPRDILVLRSVDCEYFKNKIK